MGTGGADVIAKGEADVSTTDIAVLREEILDIIEKDGMIPRDKLTPDATMESLNLASYDLVMVLMGIEDKYGVYLTVDAGLTEARTLGELLDHMARRIAAGVPDERSTEPLPTTPRAE